MHLSDRVTELLACLARQDAPAFVKHLQEALLEKSNFKLLQDELGNAAVPEV